MLCLLCMRNIFIISMQQRRQEEELYAARNESLNATLHDNKIAKTPLEIQIINFLGLQKFVLDQFVFRRKAPKYSISKVDNVNVIIGQHVYEPPPGYICLVEVLEQNGHSVPVLKLCPPRCQFTSTIIYAHGNSSDMHDSLAFIERMTKVMPAEFIIFDYSGYGCSKSTETTETTICRDMEMVLAWAAKGCSISNFILWGFSLGTYPTLYCATKYPVRGIILQSPLASVSHLFEEEINPYTRYETDFLCNINLIHTVNTEILILHSTEDEIIPIAHAKALLQKYVRINGEGRIQFLEVSRLKHNEMHKYFCTSIKNPLQMELFEFIKRIQKAAELLRYSMISDSSHRTTKLKLYSQKFSNSSHHSQIKHHRLGRHKDTVSQFSDLQNLYGQLETREITEANEEDYEVVCESGKKFKVLKKSVANQVGCFCI